MKRTAFIGLACLLGAAGVQADPCGMVPPYPVGPVTITLERTGDQLTFTSFRDGIQDIVLRPAFRGNAEQFGMLTPFPTPPAIRKVSDDIFEQIRNAVEPPVIDVDLRWGEEMGQECFRGLADMRRARSAELGIDRDEVRVLREEAVGMYQMAVLEAGSAEALSRWMTQHGYVYPAGMEGACEDFIRLGWCFVAAKARISGKDAVSPTPGMTETRPGLPEGAGFSGALQATGFRFRTEAPVLPMRLSAYNPGEERNHNIVYCLWGGPCRIRQLPETFVQRQVSGEDLLANMTDLLPMKVRYLEGDSRDREAVLNVARGDTPAVPEVLRAIWSGTFEQFATQRNPAPHNGKAKDLFASDLLATQRGILEHEYEEREQRMATLAHDLGLQGPGAEALLDEESAALRAEELGEAARELRGMTLTVVEGDFPRDVIRDHNLTFVRYEMPKRDDTVRQGLGGGWLLVWVATCVLWASIRGIWARARRVS